MARLIKTDAFEHVADIVAMVAYMIVACSIIAINDSIFTVAGTPHLISNAMHVLMLCASVKAYDPIMDELMFSFWDYIDGPR